MPAIAIVLIVVAVVVLVPLIWLITSYNRFVSQRNLIQSAWAGIDVELTRRHDLIPNLIATVQGYAAHERDTLAALTAARENASRLQGQSPAHREDAETALSQALSQVMVRAEAYPELKANTNFLQLQQELSNTEDRIAASRRFYNNNVNDFNTRVGTFPSNLVAGWFKFFEAERFALRDPSVAEVPQVSFGTPPAAPAAPAAPTAPALGDPNSFAPNALDDNGQPAPQAQPGSTASPTNPWPHQG